MYISQLLVRWGLGRHAPGNMLRYLHNTVHNVVLHYSSILSKCRITPSRRFLSPYRISCKNRTGLPDVFITFHT